MSIIDIMAAPFAECMVLVAIHTYLGIHVLRRRVIFVDLALAQTAALGATVGFLFGIMPDTTAALVFSMIFTFIGAAIFALTRIKGERVPQEAVIGLFYAIMAAAAVLVVQKTHGAEHMDDILVGSILWVKWRDVLTAAAAYGLIGAVHYLFRKQFFLISEDPDKAFELGMNVKAWDFLFYLTFGFVITFSVRVAGVLLVFVFLVAPAIMAFMITNRLRSQLAIGWSMGTIVTVLGLFVSYAGDLPSGPTVISLYGIMLAIGALIVYVARARRKTTALKWVGVGASATAAAAFLIYGIGTFLSTTSLAKSEARETVAAQIAEQQRTAAARAEESPSEIIEIESWLATVSPKRAVSPEKLAAYANCEDDEARLNLLRAELERGGKTALPLLAYFLGCEETPAFFRSEGAALLKEQLGDDCGYRSDGSGEERRAALKRAMQEMNDNE